MSNGTAEHQRLHEGETFEADHISARSARRYVVEQARGLGAGADAADTIALLTSELVTNAVLHARTDITVTVVRIASRIRVCVHDENSRMPAPAITPADATSGRGLLLVQAGSAAWGIQTDPGGKTIWFEVEL